MPHDLVVKYKNEIGSLDLSKLNPSEMNLLAAIFATLKDKGQKVIRLDFDKFRSLARVDKNINDNELGRYVTDTLKKVGAGNFVLETNENWVMFPLFEKLSVDKNEKVIQYKISKTFHQFFNDLTALYTSFPLGTYTQISGKYPKILYQHLMQYSSTGLYVEDYERFLFEVLRIPANAIRRNINSKYINPAVNKLNKYGYVPDLKVEYIRDRKTNVVKTIKFTFTPSTKSPVQIRKAEENIVNNLANFDADEEIVDIDFDKDDMPF